MSFTRSQAGVLTRRLRETRRFIQAIAGPRAFETAFKLQRKLLVGGDGIALEAFLSRPVQFWVKRNSVKKE